MKVSIKPIVIIEIIIGLCVLVGWEFLNSMGLINTAFIPAPSSIFAEFLNPELYRIFFLDASYTVSRMIVGLLIAYLLVLMILYVSIRYEVARSLSDRFRSIIKFLPPPVLIPLSILAVGINNTTVVAVVAVTGFFLILDYAFSIYRKEFSNYNQLFDAWKATNNLKYKDFFLPISHYLSYRFISTLIIWSLSITIFAEIITGMSDGFGPRLIQLQQLYQSSTLFALIIGILIIALFCERVLVHTLSRFRFDSIRAFAFGVVSILIIASIVFQGFISYGLVSDQNQGIVISTYPGTLNLPLFVYAEKFNTIGATIQTTGSGIQSIDNLLAGRVAASGYADIPNALSAINQNQSLKILSQAEELPDRPLLFFVSYEDVSKNQYSNLSGSKVGYYPNNQIIETGLDLTLLLGGASTGGNQYSSGNDPQILTQSFVSGQLDALLTIEPYATQIEQQTGQRRINPNETLITGLQFNTLPLAALLIDSRQFTEEELDAFVQGMYDALEYIETSTNNGIANEDLSQIMIQYNLDPDSYIPYFSYDQTLDPKNIDQILNLISLYDQEIGSQLEGLNTESLYFVE